MKKFIITLSIIIWLLIWVDLVSSFFIKNSTIKIVSKLSDKVFIDSDTINSNIILFESDENIKNYKLHSICNIKSEITNIENNIYTYSLKFLDNNCNNWNIYLKNEKWDILLDTNIKLNLISDIELLTKMIDYSDDYLKKIFNSFLDKKNNLKLFSNLKMDLNPEFKYKQKNRIYLELEYTLKKISDLLEARDNKYLVPVKWYLLPIKSNKIPNAWRPYREQYTDWIHHSWDIDTDFDHPVIALDNSIVIRVVDDWNWSYFNKIEYWDNLTYSQKTYNLDILRWKQIWLKTMKWDVVFYAHLNSIYSNVKVWSFIKAWTEIWKVWITGVPDKSYDDYHLDYSIQKNPYTVSKAWKYSFYDYMTWDWYLKWETRDYILKNQYNIYYH